MMPIASGAVAGPVTASFKALNLGCKVKISLKFHKFKAISQNCRPLMAKTPEEGVAPNSTDHKIILTNNPLVAENEGGSPEIRRVSAPGLEAVLLSALEMTQAGYKLISAPLPPNVPLIRAPCRSLLLSVNSRQYDAEGIMALEKALEKVRLLNHNRPPAGAEQSRDAAFIDRELLRKALGEHDLFQSK